MRKFLVFLSILLLLQSCTTSTSNLPPPYDPFKDPEYLEYLRYVHSMEDMVAKGQVAPAEAETRKYEAWKDFKESKKAQGYRQSQLALEAQRLNIQHRIADAQNTSSLAQFMQAQKIINNRANFRQRKNLVLWIAKTRAAGIQAAFSTNFELKFSK